MKRRRKRGAGGKFVSSKKRRTSRKRRRRTAVRAVATNPRRRRRRARRASPRRRRRSIYALPKSNPRRRRRGVRRRRRNPSGGGLSGGQIALATLAGASSFAASTILVPRLLPKQIQSSPVLWGLGMIGIGAITMFVLRKYPVIALSSGVPIAGAGAFLAGTAWLASSGQQAAAPQQSANLGAVVLEDLRRFQGRGMGAVVYQPAQQFTTPGRQLLGQGMGAVFSNGSMGAVEALVGDSRFSRFRAGSVGQAMGAY